MVVLLVYFINKVGQEIVVSSVPTVGGRVFGWDAQADGYFMAAMGVS